MYDMILPDLELDVTHIVENGKYFFKTGVTIGTLVLFVVFPFIL